MSITRQAQGRAVTICYPEGNPPTPDEIAMWIADAIERKVDGDLDDDKKDKLEKNLKKGYGGTPGYTVTREIGDRQCIVTVTMCYMMGDVTDEDGVTEKTRNTGTGSGPTPPGGPSNREEHRKDLHRHEIGHQVHQYKVFEVLKCLGVAPFANQWKKISKKVKKNYHNRVGGNTQSPARKQSKFTEEAMKAAIEELKKEFADGNVEDCCTELEKVAAKAK